MSVAIRNAMVMAAGLGKRMRPLTDHTPKPLIEVHGIALVDRALNWLKAAGVEEAVINTHYLAEKLEAHLVSCVAPRIHISHEAELLETGGGLVKALPLLGEVPFFSVNSDTIYVDGKDSALKRLAAAWNAEIDALLLLHPTNKAIGYGGAGDFFLDGDIPRRRGNAASAPFVFTGVQLLHPRLLRDAPAGAFSLNLLYDRALAAGRLRAIVHTGDWLHVGDPQGLALANDYFSR